MAFLIPIGAAIAGALGTVGAAAGSAGAAVSAGLGAFAPLIPEGIGTAIGTGVTGGIEGSLLGGGLSAITGGDIAKGFEGGALSGFGAGALGPALGAATGSPIIGNALGGALGGAAGGAATGGDIATSALQGGVGGALKGAFSPSTSAGAPGGGVSSAAGVAAPAGVPLASPDVTSSSLQATTGQLGGDLSIGGAPSSLTSALPGSVGTGAAGGGASGVPGLTQTPALGPGLAPNAPSLTGSLSTTIPTPGAITGGGGSTTAGGFSLGKALSNPSTDMALLLGANALMGNKKSPYASTLEGIAKNDQQQGQLLQSYLTSGTLPPGMQHALDATKSQQEAQLKSQYASHGMSGSSAEVQDSQAVADRLQAQGVQVAESLYQQGVTEMGQANSIYGTLMQEQIAQDNAFSGAVGNLASALALSSRPITYAGG